jgi:predicted AAA+ superfamily ATPase
MGRSIRIAPFYKYTYNNYYEYNHRQAVSKRLSILWKKSIERKENKNMGNNDTTSFIDDIKSKGKKSITNYVFNTVKKKFGKEYFFSFDNDKSFITQLINEYFVKKYPNIKKYCQKKATTKLSFSNAEVLIPIDKQTFIYIASGYNVPKITTKVFMSESLYAEDIYIYIFGKKMLRESRQLDKFIDKYYTNDDLGFYNVSAIYDDRNSSDATNDLYITYQKLQLRDISTLFFSHKEKELVCNHIDRFNANKDFYMKRQILYKTGILLYGEPGTGKSSFVKSLATKYRRSIVNINMADFAKLNIDSLTASINIVEYEKYIILLEDIDTLFLNRDQKDVEREDMTVINKLLQFLDSNSSPTNVIFIATTNHIDRLDSALLREGRFDLKVKVDGLSEPEARRFCDSFGLNKSDTDEIIRELLPYSTDVINQSKLQAYALAKIENKTVEKSMEIHEEKIE